MPLNETNNEVFIVDYDRNWPNVFREERDLILSTCKSLVLEIEHIGSTAIPDQKAKPIVDMMIGIESLESTEPLLEQLNNLEYQIVETGMRARLFLRKPSGAVNVQFYHLHIVEMSSWKNRIERIMRDYLCAHPNDVEAYGKLKETLAARFSEESLEYTKAKTEFIQNLINNACDDLGQPKIDVWND